MLTKKCIIKNIVQNARFCSTHSTKETLLIQKTTYQTDDWTNISSRFKPFVGVNLYRKRNHPLRLTQEEIVGFLKKWYNRNVDSSLELPVYKNLDSVELNTSVTKDPNVFYVNRELKLRTHTLNHEVKLLKSGMENFVMVADLYRRCQMDMKHFPVFHRLSVVRSKQNDTQHSETVRHLRDEQQAALIEMAKHLIGNDVKYRWTDATLATTEPSWMFEIWHQNEWHQISGGGLIRNEIFDRSERSNMAGWEIAIGLDRLAMILYNIFDIRLLWNADRQFLNQFEPKNINKRLQIESNDDEPVRKTVSERLAQRPTIQTQQQTFAMKKRKHEMHISYILPKNVDLEEFPTDDLCEFIKKNSEGVAEEVQVSETYFHPNFDTYVLNIKVVYRMGQTITRRELKNIHESSRAHAAHKFKISIRL